MSVLGRGCVETQKPHWHLSQWVNRFPAFRGVEDFSRQERSEPFQPSIQRRFWL